MRVILTILAVGALSACTTTVPDSGAGVGFDNSVEAQRAREAQLTGQSAALPPATAVSQETLTPAGSASQGAAATPPVQPTSGDAILEAAASLEARNANSGVDPLQASPSNPAPGSVQSNPGISDENDFEAVSSRQSIESDAQRIAQNRAQYQVIQPTELPSRTDANQPNVVQYALQTTHARGTRIYSRTGINMAARAQRNCAGYASADQAQIDFLAKGGPRRDRMGLDPDGDGFACDWDPAPFRNVVQN